MLSFLQGKLQDTKKWVIKIDKKSLTELFCVDYYVLADINNILLHVCRCLTDWKE